MIPTPSDSSYVEGKVKKIGNDAFDFPIGSNGHYRPISISAPSSTTDAFTGQHTNENSDPTYEHDDKESSINEISTNEYWLLDRNTGTSNVSVTLSWDDMSCGFDTLANLRVVAWKDTIWKDLGNGGTTGDTDEGTVMSGSAATVYGVYALATVDTFDCVPCRADAGEDKSIYFTYGTLIGDTAIAGVTYEWSPDYKIDDTTKAMPEVGPRYSLQYRLETTNTNGCEATDDVHIEVVQLPNLPQCIGSVGQ